MMLDDDVVAVMTGGQQPGRIEQRTDPAEVKEEVRKALRRYFKRLDRRPVILPFVLEM